MTELEMIRKALIEVHGLGRVVALNPRLSKEHQIQTEISIRTLLSLLYTRLNEIDIPHEKLPTTIKSDY